MKRSAKGWETGCWIVASAVGLYLLGFGLIWLDYVTFRTRYLDNLPEEFEMIIGMAYLPIFYSLDKLGVIPN